MRPRVYCALVPAGGLSAVAIGCGAAVTRQQVEADEDRACAGIARIRAIEVEYGINPGPDGGEAGAK